MAVIGVDFGRKRIGLAVSDSWELASPHSIIRNHGDDTAALTRVAEVGRQLDAELYVMGVPRGQRHDATRIQARFEQLASTLRERSGQDVVLWDETLSTVEAEERRRERGARKRDDIDMEAAAVILQSWLDARRNS